MNRRGLFAWPSQHGCRANGILTSRRDVVSGDNQDHQDVPDHSVVLDRRQLLGRAAVAGLVLATPKFWALDQTMIPGHVAIARHDPLILPQTLRLIPTGGPVVEAIWLNEVQQVLHRALVPSQVLAANPGEARLPFQALTEERFGAGAVVDDLLLWAPVGSGMRGWRPLESPNGGVETSVIVGT